MGGLIQFFGLGQGEAVGDQGLLFGQGGVGFETGIEDLGEDGFQRSQTRSEALWLTVNPSPELG